MTVAKESRTPFERALGHFLEQGLRSDTANCPDPEVVAAYFDRSLKASERKLLSVHFAICEPCQHRIVALARAFTASTETQDSRGNLFLPGNWPSRWVAVLASLLDGRNWIRPVAILAPAALALTIIVRLAGSPAPLSQRKPPNPEAAPLTPTEYGPAAIEAFHVEQAPPPMATPMASEALPGSAVAALEEGRSSLAGRGSAEQRLGSYASQPEALARSGAVPDHRGAQLAQRSAQATWMLPPSGSPLTYPQKSGELAEGKLLDYRAVRLDAAPDEGSSARLTLRIGVLKITPSEIKAGDRVTIDLEYALALPADEREMPIEESFQLEREGSAIALGRAEARLRQPGVWRIQVVFLVPQGLRAGDYSLTGRVRAGEIEDIQRARVAVTPA